MTAQTVENAAKAIGLGEDYRLTKEEFKKELASKIEELTKSGKWEDFLRFSKTMHKYSFSNQLWLYYQGMILGFEVSQVAAASAWKKLGRWPKKGSKSLRVLAPLMRKIKDEATGDEKSYIYGFKLVPVFDVSQTEGKDLPITDLYQPLKEGFNQDIWDALLDYSDWPVIVEDLGNKDVGGYWSPAAQHIKINEANPKAFQMSVLVHELAHAREDHKKSDRDTETVAEGVAYMVMTHYGLDVDNSAIPYIAGWTKGNTDFIQKHGDAIYKLAKEIIAHINKFVKVKDPIAEAEAEAKEDYNNKPKAKPKGKKKTPIKA